MVAQEWSHKSDRARLKVPVRVPHDSDLDQALALMREAASYPDRVLAVPAPSGFLDRLFQAAGDDGAARLKHARLANGLLGNAGDVAFRRRSMRRLFDGLPGSAGSVPLCC